MTINMAQHNAPFSFQVNDQGQVVDPGNERLIVKFYTESVEDKALSAAEGRPIYRDIVYIEKRVPADKNNIVQRPANERDKKDFPKQWAAYTDSETPSQVGTPLEQWPPMSKSLVKMLKTNHGISTVEELANVSDSNAANLGPGGLVMIQRAKAYLADAKESALADRMARENAELKMKLAALEAQVADLAARPMAPKAGEVVKTEAAAAAPTASIQQHNPIPSIAPATVAAPTAPMMSFKPRDKSAKG